MIKTSEALGLRKFFCNNSSDDYPGCNIIVIELVSFI